MKCTYAIAIPATLFPSHSRYKSYGYSHSQGLHHTCCEAITDRTSRLSWETPKFLETKFCRLAYECILCVVRGFVSSHGCSLSVRPPAVIAVSQSAAVSAQHNAVQQQSRRHQRRFDEAETAWWTLQTLHVQLKLSQQLPHADLCLHYFWRTAVIDYGRLSLYIAASDPYGNVACNLFTVYCCTRVAGNVLIVYLLLCHDRPNKFLSFSCCISL